MAISAIRTDFDEPLDVHRNLLAEVAFHHAFTFNHLANAVNFVLAQILNLLHRVHCGLTENSRRSWLADSIHVSERNIHALLTRKINACNASHSPYPRRCLCFEFAQITRTTPLRSMISHLS